MCNRIHGFTPERKRPRAKPVLKNQLTFHIYKLLEHLVGDGDDLGVGLEASLSGDHVGELVGQVYVGHL